MNQNVLINKVIKSESKDNEILRSVFLVIIGTIFLSIMSQIAIPLPGNLVPVTGQTFAVMIIALAYGQKLGTSTLLSYIAAGSIGLPVFAGFKTGLPFFLPSGGYIIGFLVAVFVCGYFADKGWTKSYAKIAVLLLLAHVIFYFFGVLQLSLFIGMEKAAVAGIVPFIPGDLIKMALTVFLLPTAWKFVK